MWITGKSPVFRFASTRFFRDMDGQVGDLFSRLFAYKITTSTQNLCGTKPWDVSLPTSDIFQSDINSLRRKKTLTQIKSWFFFGGDNPSPLIKLPSKILHPFSWKQGDLKLENVLCHPQLSRVNQIKIRRTSRCRFGETNDMQTQNYPKQQPENGKFITFNGILLDFFLLKKEIKWHWEMAPQIWIEIPCDQSKMASIHR